MVIIRDIQRVKEIFEVLADGVKPMTGATLPLQDSCNQVEGVRALHAALHIIEKSEVNEEK